MTTIDMSKDFAEARARGEAANEIDDIVQRLFIDTIGCCADLDADDQCERCRLRRDAARVLSRMQVALTAATERAERAEADLTAARALLREAQRYVVALTYESANESDVRALRARIEAHIGRDE